MGCCDGSTLSLLAPSAIGAFLDQMGAWITAEAGRCDRIKLLRDGILRVPEVLRLQVGRHFRQQVGEHFRGAHHLMSAIKSAEMFCHPRG